MVTRVTTQFQTGSSFFHSRQAPLDDRLSQHLNLSQQLCDDSKMPRARPISHRRQGVDQSLPLLLRLDLGPGLECSTLSVSPCNKNVKFE